jgi:hypothetical protein
MKLYDDRRMYAVLVCNRYHTVWQRVINAARNIRSLFINMVKHRQRPGLLDRPISTWKRRADAKRASYKYIYIYIV